MQELPNADESNLEEATSPDQMKQLLHRAMEQVRPEFEEKTWRAFERSVVEGHSTQTIAVELSISPATVRQYRARILRRLRRQLGDID